jgi:P-type conjugative transfer protein TrbJ
MKAFPAALFAVAAAGALGAGAIVPAAPAHAGMPVFDATNYAENLVQAARSLEQINNQVKALQNQASMLERMSRNLRTVSFPQLQRMTSAMQRIDGLMSEAKAIGFKVDGLDQRIDKLFPGALQRALSSDDRVAEARARLDAARDSYRSAMTVQAQVAENVREDSAMLGELAATSQDAVGALQVGQAANQLLALSVKQQLQLENLMAAEFREAAIERARRLQAEEDGRLTTRRFLDGTRGKQ